MAANTSKDVGHIAKFDGTNFPSWKYGIWMFLEKNRLTSIVDGSVTKPVEVSKVSKQVNPQKTKSLHTCEYVGLIWTHFH
jgi:hypothetical protein